MQRLFLTLAAPIFCFLIVPAELQAQARSYVARGVELEKRGELDQALANYNRALEVADPNDAENISLAYYNRGVVWGKKDEIDKAIADYSQALANDPRYVEAYNNRGMLWQEREEYDKAVADYTQGLAIAPRDASLYFNRGTTWKAMKEYDKAVADLTQGLTLSPNDDLGYFYRAMVWKLKGEYGKAIADYHQALAIDPKYVSAYNNVARLYAACPDAKYRDGAKAFEYANQAYQIDGGKSWQCVSTLAAAYAECEDFAKAAEWQTKVVEMLAGSDSVDKENLAEARSHLELYRQGKPYREKSQK